MTPDLPQEDAALLRFAHALLEGGYRFTTPTPLTHARNNARPGNARAADLSGVFGWSRPFAPDLLPAPLLALAQEAGAVVAAGEGLLRPRFRLSTLDGLAFLHSAFPTEAADSVFFGPDTYRFAAAIRAALPALGPVRRAVDIGCGAGPGALVVARACPGAEVIMGDINHAALRLARINARLNGLPGAEARHSDLLGGTEGSFDLVVSNPPYLNDGAERAYRHGGGAFGASLSLRILEAAVPRLAPGGTLLLYTGATIVKGEDTFRNAAVAHLGTYEGAWRYEELDPDVFGEELETPAYAEADRIAAVLLTVTRNG